MISIKHCLLHAPGCGVDDLEKVITHRDVLKQCGKTLRSRYPHLTVTTGTGDLEDQSKVAEAIANGTLPPSVATISSGLLAQHFDLLIGDSELADEASNESTFLLVQLC